MKRNNIVYALVVIFGITLLSSFNGIHPSCKQKEEGMIELGRKLKNPYSVKSMRKAYNNIRQKGLDIKVTTTHQYIRYLPKSEEELEKLKSDTTLELFDYPLDFEIKKTGVCYHDATLPKNVITWQYCVVKKGYKFQNIKHEVLSRLFIPELLDLGYNKGGTKQSERGDFLIELVDEALRITGNLEGTKSEVFYEKKKKKWNPSGYIKAYDDIKNGYVPVVGAKVRARRWFNVKVSYTNSSGYFVTGSFKRKVNYSIKWENSKYDIRDGSLNQAYFNGPKKKGAWNLNISSGKSLRFSTIHRAAYRYHHQNIGGLKRPNVWSKLKFSYYHKKSNGSYIGMNLGNWDFTGVFPKIQLFGKSSQGWLPTNEVFSTTIHEIGHASHIELMNYGEIQFIQVSDIIVESWADAVQWYITKIEYNDLGFPNYDTPKMYPSSKNIDNKQRWLPSSPTRKIYTPLFIDLVDRYNQSLKSFDQPSNRCPSGGTFNGSMCYVGTAPNGKQAGMFGNTFYYLPDNGNACSLPNTFSHHGYCHVLSFPNNVLPYIGDNRTTWNLYPAGDDKYPYDEISGYTMAGLEQMLKHVYGLGSLKRELKSNMPVGFSVKKLYFYFKYYSKL